MKRSLSEMTDQNQDQDLELILPSPAEIQVSLSVRRNIDGLLPSQLD